MSNQYNTNIAESAIDFVDKMMDLNPTIPAEARNSLIVGEIRKRIEETIEEEGEVDYEERGDDSAKYEHDTEPEDWDLIDCTQGGLMEVSDES